MVLYYVTVGLYCVTVGVYCVLLVIDGVDCCYTTWGRVDVDGGTCVLFGGKCCILLGEM